MENFDGKIAVITGGGTGMGRELTYQLAAEGCHVSICDVIEENMEETFQEATNKYPQVKITKHLCDVSSCLLYTSPSPRDSSPSRMPSSA